MRGQTLNPLSHFTLFTQPVFPLPPASHLFLCFPQSQGTACSPLSRSAGWLLCTVNVCVVPVQTRLTNERERLRSTDLFPLREETPAAGSYLTLNSGQLFIKLSSKPQKLIPKPKIMTDSLSSRTPFLFLSTFSYPLLPKLFHVKLERVKWEWDLIMIYFEPEMRTWKDPDIWFSQFLSRQLLLKISSRKKEITGTGNRLSLSLIYTAF